MKITVELPDSAVCAFVNYIFMSDTGLSMGARSISSDDIKNGYSKFEGVQND